MATEKKAKYQTDKSEEIVVDLDTIAVPGAIILAGLVIAGAIFLTNRNKSDDTTDVSGESETAQEEGSNEQFPTASTAIGDSPYLGDIDKAKVALVEYTDFQCPYCQKYADETKADIISNYVDTGEIIYVIRNLPLDFHGQIAIDSAHAGLCVNEIAGAEKYFEFYSKAFSQTSTDDLANIANDMGIDMGKYNACMDSDRYVNAIEADKSAAESAGVSGTPGFVIGVLDEDGNVEGKLIAGAYPYDSFASIIDEMLAK
jgi:protein-disulfide isomerase